MHNMHLISFALLLFLTPPSCALAQNEGIVMQTLDNPDNEPAPVFPVPSERQMKWQETEFYAFFTTE